MDLFRPLVALIALLSFFAMVAIPVIGLCLILAEIVRP
jgi:hypothetical protein